MPAPIKGQCYLTAHEIGHNYFPFYVMTNESFYAFMDEGLVSFIPRLVEGILLEDPHPMKNIVQGYAAQAANMRQVPLMVPSDMISDYAAYRVHSYTRPANAFFILQQMLGADLFKEAMLEYIQRWKKKHPTPYDFFNTIEDVTGKELEWFWEPWFFDFGYPDLAIDQVEHTDDQLTIAIKKKGALPVPVKLKIRFSDGTSETIDHSAAVWSDEDRFVVSLKTKRRLLVLPSRDEYPDSRPEDNVHAQQKE
ncbi:MAG: M1 family aminopeptidase [Bacteroidales bacterium]|nr:M1 family aminopeptidase [Bacteroidales bacterium]